MNWLDAEFLVGERYTADVTVVAISPSRPDLLYDPDRLVTLEQVGERFDLTLAEFRVAVEAGFLVQQPARELTRLGIRPS